MRGWSIIPAISYQLLIEEVQLPRVVHVKFVVYKMELTKAFTKYFNIPLS
jgi:hypothetical protein